MRHIRRSAAALALALVSLVLVSPHAAAGDDHGGPGEILADLWETVFEIPAPANPYTGGDPCIDLGRVVAPLAPPGTLKVDCRIRSGIGFFVTAWSSECSTVEAPPYHGDNERQLRACARAADARLQTPTVTLNGRSVRLSEVETSLIRARLPWGNIFDVRPRPAFSVAHGWVALLPELRPGRHTILITVKGTNVFGETVDFTNTTTVIVKPRW